MFDLKSLGLTATLASIGVFWSNIKNLFIRARSVFIVEANFEYKFQFDRVIGYMDSKYKKSKFGSMNFDSRKVFITKENKIKHVSVELPSKVTTYWNGVFPIFASSSSGNNNPSTFSISFIRGTLDIDEVLKEVDERNYNLSTNTKSSNRYYIKRVYGSFNKEEDAPRGLTENTITESDLDLEATRLVGYDKSEIGRPKPIDPFSSLYYDNNVNTFMKEFDDHMNAKEWFNTRGLNWKMGTLLKGPPGTGKTSFVKAVAQKYNLPIVMLDLISMSNEEFQKSWESEVLCRTPCIALFEDLDRLYDNDGNMIKNNQIKVKGELTTDAILNCLSGVSEGEGVLTFITANEPEKLPQALTRAGRVDSILELGCLTEESKKQMAFRIVAGKCHTDTSSVSKEEYQIIKMLLEDKSSVTGAEFQQKCTKAALDFYWGRK